jgi:hypothetical protein
LKSRLLILNLFILFSILSKSVFAIDHVLELKKAQNWANSFSKYYPIFVINRDEFHYLFLKNKATQLTKEAERKRINLIKNYFSQEKNYQLTQSEATNFENYLFSQTQSAVALPFFDSHSNQSKHKFCAVFANAPNGNARIEIERLTGLENKKIYQNKKYDQLSLKEDFAVMYLFSLYHEMSHCLDKTFLPKIYKNYEISPHDIHKSESFAEVFAYLHLAKTLDFNIAKARILYRTIYARVVGEYFAQNPSVAFGDPNILAAGGTYFLTPVLVQAYSLISSHKVDLIKISDNELNQLAEEIIDDYSLDFRSFTAIIRSLVDKDLIFAEYEAKAYKSPDLFLKSYTDLVSFYSITDLWLVNAFDQNILDMVESNQSAPPLPKKQLCQDLKESTPASFLKTINEYRETLENVISSYESRKQRYKDLNSLAQSLSESCALEQLLP